MKCLMCHKSGLTMIELVAVIVLLGIISSIGFFTIGNVIENQRETADLIELNNINSATQLMLATTDDNPFLELATTEEQLAYLVEMGFLSTIPDVKSKNASYVYIQEQLTWVLESSDGEIAYTETEEIYFTISGSKITAYNTNGGLNIVIPKEIEGVAIEEIGQDSFKNLELESVVIQEGITRISGNAFHTNELTTIAFPDSVTRIWHNAFYDNEISSVTFGSGLLRIEAGAFANNSITVLELPENLTFIGAGAFGYGNNYITSITIGSNVVIENAVSMGRYGSGFKTLYDVSKEAGTYVYENGSWSKI